MPCRLFSLTCRQRHLKCTTYPNYFECAGLCARTFSDCLISGDKTGDECLRCQRSGRRCIPAPTKPEEITFRHGQNPSLRAKGPPRYGESDLTFPDDQTWVRMPSEGPPAVLFGR